MYDCGSQRHGIRWLLVAKASRASGSWQVGLMQQKHRGENQQEVPFSSPSPRPKTPAGSEPGPKSLVCPPLAQLAPRPQSGYGFHLEYHQAAIITGGGGVPEYLGDFDDRGWKMLQNHVMDLARMLPLCIPHCRLLTTIAVRGAAPYPLVQLTNWAY